MADIAPQDTRCFFMLPQAPEGTGYYVYGTPAHGAALDATRLLITLFHTATAVSLVIFFNDNRMPGVRPLAGHDNHFHVQF
jgi:hypothetical protein